MAADNFSRNTKCLVCDGRAKVGRGRVGRFAPPDRALVVYVRERGVFQPLGAVHARCVTRLRGWAAS